jgi:hypothetical protein
MGALYHGDSFGGGNMQVAKVSHWKFGFYYVFAGCFGTFTVNFFSRINNDDIPGAARSLTQLKWTLAIGAVVFVLSVIVKWLRRKREARLPISN